MMKKLKSNYTSLSQASAGNVIPVRPLRLSVWGYLLAQVTAPFPDDVQSVKHERVYNFLHVPQKLEQVEHSGGGLLALDSRC